MAGETHKIRVRSKGPYVVEGGIPLVRKEQVVSEHGEPLTWKRGESIPCGDDYVLCRCGESGNKPFCDGTHRSIGFDGAEAPEAATFAQRQVTYEGTGIQIKDDRSLCMHAGFCGNQVTNVWKMSQSSDDTRVRAQIMAMIERCPSGALAYSVEKDDADIEPSLPKEIALTPDGALWVSGGIPIERSDGSILETRNRVTLCRCGASKNKPLCDGSHKDIGFSG